VRLAKVATLLKTDLVRVLGRLTDSDRQQLALSWDNLFRDFVS
jgi:hypothetical protein